MANIAKRLRKPRILPDGQNIAPAPCAFGCGAISQGSLHVSWSPCGMYDADLTPRESETRRSQAIMFSLPTCAACARGAVKVSVSIPKAGGQ